MRCRQPGFVKLAAARLEHHDVLVRGWFNRRIGGEWIWPRLAFGGAIGEGNRRPWLGCRDDEKRNAAHRAEVRMKWLRRSNRVDVSGRVGIHGKLIDRRVP